MLPIDGKAGGQAGGQAAPAISIQEYLGGKFGPTKSKQEILAALETCTVLHRLPLSPPSVSIEQAQKDFKRERILLNDVAFIPDKDDDQRSVAFDLTLRVLLQRLMRVDSVYDNQVFRCPDDVADLLMQRACRTSAGADSFFMIQQLLCVENCFLSQNTTVSEDPPIHIDVFLSDQAAFNRASRNSTISTVTEEWLAVEEMPHLCARMLISNSFSIFDSPAEDWEDLPSEPAPWLEIDSIVVDESDLRTGEHWRKLHLVVTHIESGRTFSSFDDAPGQLLHTHLPPQPTVLQTLSSWLNTASCRSSGSNSSTYNSHTLQADDDSMLERCNSQSQRDDQTHPLF